MDGTSTTRQSESAAGAPRRIIAMMNQKGGVGKTTTTVNLAAALAQAGRRTLIVDLDPQAHATLHLGVDAASLDATVYDALHDPEGRACDGVTPARERLDLLPAEVNLAASEVELAASTDRHHRLARALESIGSNHDFVFIDCPPSLGLLTLNALSAADEVLVPMQAHFLALQGVGKLLETVRMVAHGAGASLRVGGVILCMHDEQPTHTREVVADLESFFAEASASGGPWAGARVLRPAIRRNIKLAECPSFGQTIFEYAPAAAGAEDYRRLAEAFLTPPAQTPSPKVVIPAPLERQAAAHDER